MATQPHPYKLRAYHNPERIDESKVPDGWRFLYADEAGQVQDKPCRLWINFRLGFGLSQRCRGAEHTLTYIVPVNA
jgi:hypothetical protein